MAVGESLQLGGKRIRSFFVCFSYGFKGATNMAWNSEEATAAESVLDMGRVVTVWGG
jgi:hypothetical protein